MTLRRTRQPARGAGPSSTLTLALAIPLVPFVAAWEAAGAIKHGLGVAGRWTFRELGALGRWTLERLRALLGWFAVGSRTVAGWFTALARLIGRRMMVELRELVRGIVWAAARILFPIIVRAWTLLRALARGALVTVQGMCARLVVPLRLVARATLALLLRAGVLLRTGVRLTWLTLVAIGARILLPLRLAARAIMALGRRLLLTVRGLILAITLAFRAAGRWLMDWILGPSLRAVARAIVAAFKLMEAIASRLTEAARRALDVVTQAVLSARNELILDGQAIAAAARRVWQPVHVLIGRVASLLAVTTARVLQLLHSMAHLIALAAQLAWRPVRWALTLIGSILSASRRLAVQAVRYLSRLIAAAAQLAWQPVRWLASLLGSILSTSLRLALQAVRYLSHLIAAAAQLAWQPVRWLLSWIRWTLVRSLRLAVRAVRYLSHLIAAAARLAWRPVQAVLRQAALVLATALRFARQAVTAVIRPVLVAWRAATDVVAAAVVKAARTVRDSVRTARITVRLAIHEARNGVRYFFGRPPLPFVERAPTRALSSRRRVAARRHADAARGPRPRRRSSSRTGQEQLGIHREWLAWVEVHLGRDPVRADLAAAAATTAIMAGLGPNGAVEAAQFAWNAGPSQDAATGVGSGRT